MDHAEKIRRLEQILAGETHPDPLTYFLLGREYLEAGRFEDAAGALQRCVELNPQYTAAYRFLGDSWRKAGNTERARQAYELGIAVATETGDLQAGKEMEVLLGRMNKP